MKLSVIICTYNRAKYLYNLLKSIAQNTLGKNNFEVLLIDNNSNDNTISVLEQFKTDFPEMEIRYFFENRQGLSFARNRGIKEATGEVLVYVDDDALVLPEDPSSRYTKPKNRNG